MVRGFAVQGWVYKLVESLCGKSPNDRQIARIYNIFQGSSTEDVGINSIFPSKAPTTKY